MDVWAGIACMDVWAGIVAEQHRDAMRQEFSETRPRVPPTVQWAQSAVALRRACEASTSWVRDVYKNSAAMPR